MIFLIFFWFDDMITIVPYDQDASLHWQQFYCIAYERRKCRTWVDLVNYAPYNMFPLLVGLSRELVISYNRIRNGNPMNKPNKQPFTDSVCDFDDFCMFGYVSKNFYRHFKKALMKTLTSKRHKSIFKEKTTIRNFAH